MPVTQSGLIDERTIGADYGLCLFQIVPCLQCQPVEGGGVEGEGKADGDVGGDGVGAVVEGFDVARGYAGATGELGGVECAGDQLYVQEYVVGLAKRGPAGSSLGWISGLFLPPDGIESLTQYGYVGRTNKLVSQLLPVAQMRADRRIEIPGHISHLRKMIPETAGVAWPAPPLPMRRFRCEGRHSASQPTSCIRRPSPSAPIPSAPGRADPVHSHSRTSSKYAPTALH